MITPLASKALFWRVKHLEESRFLCHVPFLFWLLEAQRPTCAVQLGLHDTVAYLALCQALDMMGVDSNCYGVAGYAPAAEVETLEQLERRNADLYDSFSRIFRDNPSQVLRRVPDGSINFILVDGPLDDTGLAALETDWLAALAQDGVLVLHGFDTHFSQGPARALADRLMDTHPTILMEGGDGLLVVLGGSQPADKLRRMAELRLGKKGHGEIRQVFSRLGKALHYEALVRENSAAKRAQWEARLEAAEAGRLQDSEAHATELAEVQERHTLESAQAAEHHAAELVHQQAVFEETAAEHAKALSDQEAAHALALEEVTQAHAVELARIEELHAAQLAQQQMTLQEVTEAHAAALAQRDADHAQKLDDSEKELQTYLASLSEITADRDRVLDTLKQKQRDSAEALTAKEQALQTLRTRLEDTLRVACQTERAYREQIASQKNDLQGMAEQVETAKAEASEILLSMVRRCESLSGDILEGQRALKMAKAREAKRFEELGLMTRMLEQERALWAATTQLAEEMIQSSSWKVTKPARQFVQLIRGEK